MHTGNGRSIVTDDSRNRHENKRIYGGATYQFHNWGLSVDERREGKHPHRRLNSCLKHHAEDLKNDPERLSTEFMLSLIH